jgi:hypothetical protein
VASDLLKTWQSIPVLRRLRKGCAANEPVQGSSAKEKMCGCCVAKEGHCFTNCAEVEKNRVVHKLDNLRIAQLANINLSSLELFVTLHSSPLQQKNVGALLKKSLLSSTQHQWVGRCGRPMRVVGFLWSEIGEMQTMQQAERHLMPL